MLDSFPTRLGDCILASMAQQLPFRPKIFDSCSSTSAVHYVLNKPTELSTMISSLDKTVIGDSAFQLFPKDVADLEQIKTWSPWSGFTIVGDKPHKKDVRWYVLLSRSAKPATFPQCHLFPGATCLQAFTHSRASIDQEYWEWLDREHARFCKRQIRIGQPFDPHSC